ncbi:unnamed protein product [Prorocentrum cordatum]|uniref:Uncharacterized protein n=1 Tax=Prorocentrum cordatum TaxID=2364126 RepID=A0ABN9XMA9_9DINO|nr:unnamed protein product [Polarella glacialis]
MVDQTLLTTAAALAVFALSRQLPSPYKEVALLCTCAGALYGKSAWEAWQARRSALPPEAARSAKED